MKKLLAISIFYFSASSSFAAINADDILGVWANSSNKAHIHIYKESGKYYGKIVWLKNPNDASGKPKIDKKNPDENARDKRIIGLVVLRDFKFDDDEWKSGRIYNPEDGKVYKSFIKLHDKKHLSVRGYIGFSLLGKTEKFIKVK